ncbi:MAG: glycoside hydrolase family 65 protein [Oscillospiraceae bacterium]|nr:glycoside hydrolase family 65 protein [Oscillospiraceae bacterium]
MSGTARFPYEPWTVTEDGFQNAYLRESESVFALGNGLIGMRGNLEELDASGSESIQGTYLNGVFDSEPIVYGESAYGYAKNHETICSVMDAKSLFIEADGETLDLGLCRVEAHRRVLDMRAGLLRRSFVWHTESGCALRVETERLVSLTRQELAATRLHIACESGACTLRLMSFIAPAVIAQGDPNDPRNAAGKDRSLRIGALSAEGTLLRMQQKTKRSGFTINCAAEQRCSFPYASSVTGERAEFTAELTLNPGETLTFERSICYTATAADEPDRWEETAALARSAPAFDALCAEQRACLDAFWDRAGIDIEGDDALLQGLRFNLFHLFQSVGRDGRRNIAAKGLTGEGYEGHTFWDTEAYILPVFVYTEPTLARRLLEYRYAILPRARERARIMGHSRGALYAWRTIDGEECSAYFPAGTAQYHINGDVAHAVREYWQATEDLDFMARCGAEILVETARLYADLGFFSAEKGGRFVLNCVTGPDEYNVMVNNNVYTNRVAEENLRSAAEALALLRARCPEDYARLCRELAIAPDEAESWLVAADRMYYPPSRDGIFPQDDGFLDRKPWPLASIPPENHPLLMHYHGLVIYRHMICKQADLILALTQYGERYTLEEKKKNFAFYDSVTTHDSSLSMAVFSILANEIGEYETAYDYFMSSARLDLDDMHRNTKDGLHMANMAGTFNCVTRGFGGMRVRDGALHFAPVCPPQWQGYAFRVCFRGRVIEVRVRADGASYALLRGEAITVFSDGEALELK